MLRVYTFLSALHTNTGYAIEIQINSRRKRSFSRRC